MAKKLWLTVYKPAYDCGAFDAPAEQLCSLKRLSLVPQVPQIEIKWDVLDARDVESI